MLSSCWSSYQTAALALVIFVTAFPNSISKPQEPSDDVLNNEIRRSVNDGFTITSEDKEYFERTINDIQGENRKEGDAKEEVRIVDGQEAKLGELPYQCALEFSSGFSYCGAALIDPLETNVPKYVITADHCVKDRSKESLQVVCGTLKMSDTKAWNKFRIKEIYEHPYSTVTKIGDVAIIELEDAHSGLTHRADIGSNGMEAIRIPDWDTFKKFSGTQCTVSGWGRQASGAATKPDTLRKANVLVPSQEKCSAMYVDVTDKFKEDSMMCAGGADRDACQGDSGGPLKCVVDGKAYLAGLVSWGIGCATEGVPGGYTNVAAYRKWIIDTVNEAEKKS